MTELATWQTRHEASAAQVERALTGEHALLLDRFGSLERQLRCAWGPQAPLHFDRKLGRHVYVLISHIPYRPHALSVRSLFHQCWHFCTFYQCRGMVPLSSVAILTPASLAPWAGGCRVGGDAQPVLTARLGTTARVLPSQLADGLARGRHPRAPGQLDAHAGGQRGVAGGTRRARQGQDQRAPRGRGRQAGARKAGHDAGPCGRSIPPTDSAADDASQGDSAHHWEASMAVWRPHWRYAADSS